eukprot:m.16614 g.16614  ORF g.16614 m.16614 type:complete len:656 (+) comp3404_c0_seq1:21-1988(+)
MSANGATGRGTLTSWLKEKLDIGGRRDAVVDAGEADACALKMSDLRVVVFGQARRQSRRLLFDSLRAGARTSRSGSSMSPLKAKNEDLLTEMVFGSIPSAFTATTTKLHEVQEPPQVVATLLFNALGDDVADATPPSTPMQAQPPLRGPDGVASPAGIASTSATHPLLPPRFSCSPCATPRSSKPELVMAVCVVVNICNTPDFPTFARQHFMTLEHMLHSIKAHVTGIARAVMRDANASPGQVLGVQLDELALELRASARFQAILHELKERFRSLYAAERLPNPAWYTLCRHAELQKYRTGVSSVAAEITATIRTFCKNNQNKTFLAKSLTAVLNHHCGWISTVLPIRLAWPADCQGTRMQNQLRELYGVTPLLSEMTRTVVVGKNVSVVRQMLQILSYFLRCSRSSLQPRRDVPTTTTTTDTAHNSPVHSPSSSRRSSFSDDGHGVDEADVLETFERVLLEPSDGVMGSDGSHRNGYNGAFPTIFGDVGKVLVPFLALQGMTKMPTMKAVADDLCQHYKYSIVGCPIECARCIFIDTDNLSVDVVDVQRSSRSTRGDRGDLTYHVEVLKQPSLGIKRTLTSFLGCFDLGLAPEVCLEQLEGGLHELCVASDVMMLLDTMDSSASTLPPGISVSDVPLLEAIGRYIEQSEPCPWS